MLASLLPPVVVAVEALGDDPPGTGASGVPEVAVFPGEEDLIAKAVPARRREFVTARRCAREALRQLGHRPAPIRSGPHREPIWPDGVLGSITHCAGYRAAAVARAAEVTALGIDAESHAALPDGVRELVTTDGEPDMLAELSRTHPDVHWDRLLFSAKESIYKAWFPAHRGWLGFEDATLTIDPATHTFAARLRPGGELRGRFLTTPTLVLTAIAIPTP